MEPIRTRGALAPSMVLAAVLLLRSVAPALATSANPEVDRAKAHLAQIDQRIGARRTSLRSLQRSLNRLATQIAASETRVLVTRLRIRVIGRQVDALRARSRELQREIDQRSRDAYMLGPGSAVTMVLDARSYADLADAIGYLGELNLRDGQTATQLEDTELRLVFETGQLTMLIAARTRLLHELDGQRKALRGKFAQERRILASLKQQKGDVVALISRLRPFAVCPVRGPHAVSNDFGAPRYEGGFHLHQGNDIVAPYGTPIVAPFDGLAVAGHDALGGLSGDVYGAFGHVYNAHLSRLGALGRVTTGTVIGYVGTSGDARGGTPHDHFEWHPGNGPAVDPHGYLMLVC